MVRLKAMVASSRDSDQLSILTGSVTESTRNANEEAGTVETSGNIDFRIGRDGTWFYQGSPITRKSLVRLFASVLEREDNGEFYLVTPFERCTVKVDDAPFTVVEVNSQGKGEEQVLMFRTNLDEIVVADAGHPIRVAYQALTGEPAPYVTVRGGLEALIARPVYYRLVELSVEERRGRDSVYTVRSRGVKFEIGCIHGQEYTS